MLYRLFPHAVVLMALAPLCAGAPATAPSLSDSGFENVVKPFFSQHCNSCHGEKKQKGELRLDTLKIDPESPKTMGHWMEVMGRITSGDMPPEKQPRPRADDIAHVSE